jgi:nuclear pore complex protein Nup133
MARLPFKTNSRTYRSSSDSEIIRPNHDLNAHMMGRKDKLNFLIKFINDNAALSKVLVISLDRVSLAC